MSPAPLQSLVEVYSAHAAYFEGYVAEIIVLFCNFQKSSDSGNISKLPHIFKKWVDFFLWQRVPVHLWQ